MLNISQSIISFNCYQNNGTCDLFVNYSQTVLYRMEDDPETIFYFLLLPPESINNLFWAFDGSINEAFNRMDAISNENISFVSPGVYGRGSAIYFNGSQYLNMSSTYLNLSSNSFSFEMWIYPLFLRNASKYGCGILGQCQFASTSACLQLEIRYLSPYFGFYHNDCPGHTFLTNNSWYHLAFVYNATAQEQLTFLNGELDCNRTANALQITDNNIPLTIGVDLFVKNATQRYFHGYIDQLSYVNRPKDSNEILDDATLIAYFSFNQGSLLDSGPNQMNGTAYQLSLINDAVLFNQTFSSFQIETFDSSDISNSSSSIAFWINPSSINDSTIVYNLFNINTSISLYWNMIRFDNQSHLISQTQANETVSITGLVIVLNVWTHIAQTYSLINGFTIYINGTFINRTGPITYMNTKRTQTIILGNFPQSYQNYSIGLIAGSPYVGLIDEFRIYSKELSSSDIQSLIYR